MLAQDFNSRPRSVLAQTKTIPVTEEFLKAAEDAIAERDHLRIVVELKDQQIGALNGFIEIQREQVKQWSTAALERKDAIKFDDAAAKLQGEEILRVRGERDKARDGQKWWGVGGIVIGIVVGVLSQRRN